MLNTLIGAFALLSFATAQSVTRTVSASASGTQALPTGATTVSLFVPGADPQPIVASVISTAPSVTAYRINCPPGADSNTCGLALGANLTVSSSSIYEFIYTNGPFSINYKCTVQSSAVCAETSRGGGSMTVAFTSTETVNAASVTYLPVVVTAGAEKLSASGSASASGNRTATSSSASRSGSASGAASSSGAANVGNAVDMASAMSFTGLLSVLLGLL